MLKAPLSSSWKTKMFRLCFGNLFLQSGPSEPYFKVATTPPSQKTYTQYSHILLLKLVGAQPPHLVSQFCSEHLVGKMFILAAQTTQTRSSLTHSPNNYRCYIKLGPYIKLNGVISLLKLKGVISKHISGLVVSATRIQTFAVFLCHVAGSVGNWLTIAEDGLQEQGVKVGSVSG